MFEREGKVERESGGGGGREKVEGEGFIFIQSSERNSVACDEHMSDRRREWGGEGDHYMLCS